MKLTRYIFSVIALLSVFGISAQQSEYAIYNYRNDGNFNAWLNVNVDSITYSKIGIDNIEYNAIVTQEVWTPDSCYRIPIAVIDSIGFRAPEPVLREGIFYLRDYHAEHTAEIDSLTLYFDKSILRDSLPSVGQVVLHGVNTHPYEVGFAGKVKSIKEEAGQIVVDCEMICVADVYKRLVLAGRAITEIDDESGAKSKGLSDNSRIGDEPWLKYEDNDVIIKNLGDIHLNILDGLFFVNSIKPTLRVDYYVYVDEVFYDMSATIRLTHNDLEYGIDLNLNKLLAIDDTVAADKDLKNITEALIRMNNYKNMDQEGWMESIVEEVKKKGEKDKLDADQAGLLEGLWKKAHKEWEIPIGGPFTLGIEVGPLLDLKGSVDIQGKLKTTGRNTIFLHAKGYTAATLSNPKIALATGLAKVDGSSDFHVDPIKSVSLGITAKASLSVGILVKASLNLIHKSVVHVGGNVKAGLKVAGEIGFTWDSETAFSEDFTHWYDYTYEGVKNTKVKLEPFVSLGVELGVSPWSFLSVGAEYEIWKGDLGSCYLFPHFTQPALPTFNSEKQQWSNGNSNNHVVLQSYPSKNIPDILLGPCKLSLRIVDENGTIVKETEESEYRDDGTLVWQLFPLEIDLSDLTPGKTYRCIPILRYHDWWKLRATPSYEFTMPQDLSASPSNLSIPVGNSAVTQIIGGWDTFAAVIEEGEEFASIVHDDSDPRKLKIYGKKQGRAKLKIEDMRSKQVTYVPVRVQSQYEPTTETFTVNGVSFKMIGVEGGTFQMGATPEQESPYDGEKPVHSVTLSSYSIGETEVTQALWKAVMGGNPSEFIGDNLPVEQVSWNDCHTFITKLNQLTGKTFRLPTEAEWEYAARGGDRSNGYQYSGSNDLDEVAWYLDNSSSTTHPVGTKQANELGIYDMSGNVCEWCQDWYGYYNSSSQTNPTGPASGIGRVYRGGACNNTDRCRTACRSSYTPGDTDYSLWGIRLVLSDLNPGPEPDNHEYVDLGLPSGTLWATCNVGANSPEEYGDYFAWGETEPKNEYNWGSYKWMNSGQSSSTQINKYTTEDGLTELLPEDDAATANWGSEWQMPSNEQIQELIDNTRTTYTSQGGKRGRLCTGLNGNSIFLPAAGSRNGTSLNDRGSYGHYWSRSLGSINSKFSGNLYFLTGDGVFWSENISRFLGDSVRPVRVQKKNDLTTQTFTVNGVSFKMIPVEGGAFQMGATPEQESQDSDESPVHSVTLSSYSIGQTEVTQALWKAVMGDNPSRFSGDNLPVEQVSWNDCQTFITKLNQLTGKTFRLPTEAEWEFAARGGNKSQGYQYSGSSNIDAVAWYWDNCSSTTHPVGTKQANELGIYDMSGNVYEWCQDWYGDYSSTAQTNPTGPSSGSYRVFRGGGWLDDAGYCRSAYRYSDAPGNRSYNLGLRLVLSE